MVWIVNAIKLRSLYYPIHSIPINVSFGKIWSGTNCFAHWCIWWNLRFWWIIIRRFFMATMRWAIQFFLDASQWFRNFFIWWNGATTLRQVNLCIHRATHQPIGIVIFASTHFDWRILIAISRFHDWKFNFMCVDGIGHAPWIFTTKWWNWGSFAHEYNSVFQFFARYNYQWAQYVAVSKSIDRSSAFASD